MRKTGSAYGNPPVKALEPAEFIGSRTCVAAPLGRSKAPYFINNPVGIGEGVSMRACHFHAFRRMGDYLAALTAKDKFIIV